MARGVGPTPRASAFARAFRAAHANHHATARATSDAIRARDGVVLVRVARRHPPRLFPAAAVASLSLTAAPAASPSPLTPSPSPFPFPRANAAGRRTPKRVSSLDGWYTRRPSAVTASVVVFFASLGARRTKRRFSRRRGPITERDYPHPRRREGRPASPSAPSRGRRARAFPSGAVERRRGSPSRPRRRPEPGLSEPGAPSPPPAPPPDAYARCPYVPPRYAPRRANRRRSRRLDTERQRP